MPVGRGPEGSQRAEGILWGCRHPSHAQPLFSAQFPNPHGIPAPSRALCPAHESSGKAQPEFHAWLIPGLEQGTGTNHRSAEKAQTLPGGLRTPDTRRERVGIHIPGCPNPGRSLRVCRSLEGKIPVKIGSSCSLFPFPPPVFTRRGGDCHLSPLY